MQLGNVKKSFAALLTVPLAASVVLAGCGGDTKLDARRSSTATSTRAATVTPSTTAGFSTSTASPKTDPNIPAAARAHTPSGAEAFTKYFFERMNIAWTAPRMGILSPLCQSSSKACAAYEKTATRLAKEKHRYDGNPVTVKFIGVLNATNPAKYEILVTLVQELRSEVDAAGKTVVTDNRKDFKTTVELLYTDRGWSVATIKIMK